MNDDLQNKIVCMLPSQVDGKALPKHGLDGNTSEAAVKALEAAALQVCLAKTGILRIHSPPE